MIDRVPKYPGRVRLTPVAGQDGLYDMVRADEPTQVGTPLSKAALLTDTVSQLIQTLAGSAPSTPNEAFAAITAKTQSLWDGRTQIATGSYVGTGTYGEANPCSLTFNFSPKWVVMLNHIGRSDEKWFWYVEEITTDYVAGNGWGSTPSSSYSLYGKKSADGRTLSWYINLTDYPGGVYQYNMASIKYQYYAIG